MGIKMFLKYKIIGVVLAELKEGEAYDLGDGAGVMAEEALDRNVGKKRSEYAEVDVIRAARAFLQGFENRLMKNMPENLKAKLKEK